MRLAKTTLALALLGAPMALAAAAPGCGGDTPPVKYPSAEAGAGAAVTTDQGAEVGIAGPQVHAEVSEDAKSAYEKGWKAWLAGDLATAKTAFEEASRKDTKAPAPLYSLGTVLERLGDNAGALLAYKAAVSKSADFEPAIGSYAMLLARTGKVSDAEAYVQGYVNKKPDSPRLKVYLGEIKSLNKDSAGAQQLAQEALKIDPDFKDAMVLVARDHHRAGRADLARYALTAILDGFGEGSPPRDKDNAEARLLRGILEKEAGHRLRAMQDFEVAQNKRPDLVEATIQLGVLKLESGNAMEAQPILERATKYAPKSALAHLNLGDCYRILGRPTDAKKEFDIALSLDSSLMQAHYALGLLYLFTPSFPGMSASDQLAAAKRELGQYKTMRGPKPLPGVTDDIDELIGRVARKEAEMQMGSGGGATAPAASAPKPAAADGGKAK